MSIYIHPSAIVDEGADLGDGTKVWHFSHIMPDVQCGERCNIGQNVFIANGVRLGNGVKIQNNVSLYTGVVCEDDVFLGPSMVFTNVMNPRAFIERKTEYRETIIRQGASVGANATIVCGNEIGRYSFIGAGSVVTRPVPDFALVYGNPAKIHSYVSRYGHKLQFDVEGKALCPETGEQYEKKNHKIILSSELS